MYSEFGNFLTKKNISSRVLNILCAKIMVCSQAFTLHCDMAKTSTTTVIFVLGKKEDFFSTFILYLCTEGLSGLLKAELVKLFCLDVK